MEEAAYRPHALRVMAEYMSDDPVWDSDLDHMGPVVLQDLGVSTQLVQRLQAWNERFNGLALTDFEFTSVDEERSWRREGLTLAYELQNELPDIEISYAEDTDPRPVRDRRGP
ncbi:hypothetical protein [Actinoplanes xinjiangensis]|uniref:Uncharacterized protein n=1 Tax=Actinoplanes xinjiangensis TaxID=512350 RepID=A0A316EAS5_9ACTN|nr:hypothetical protein [Actinoplanes xinjiangensis]PWK27232.1 hypothetical protein BC793_15614 [Actinoplanes xinjiangensis]GIF45264.1 hypothetical protein Axi01nite_95750 [Actinoplanes xinjiangensis]